jgi:signal transduction histidine kinase/putative methionine-R-sulfoxide reductase with GAF domain
MDAPRVGAIDERAARLQLLAEVARQTTAIRSLEDLLQSAVFVIRDAFSYYLVNIFLVDGADIVFRAGTGASLQNLVNRLRLRIGVDGITGWVAGHGVARNVPDVSRDPWYRWEIEEELRTRAELAVPIALEGRVIGVLDVQSEQPGAFSDLDVVTQQAVADQLAVAIENARLYGELHQELGARARREHLLRSLGDAGLAMLKASAPADVLAAMGSELARGRLACALYLTDDPPRTATPAWQTEGAAKRLAGALGVSSAASPLLIADSEPLRTIAAGEPALFVPPSSIAAALLVEDRLLGFAVVQGEALSADDVPAIRVLATQAATAWRKAQLLQDLESSLEQLRRAQQQLIQAQKMEAIGRLAGGVAHDFNNLLTAILGYTEILLDGVPEGQSLREDVEGIRQAARRAADLTRQLLAFGSKQVLQPRVMDCNALLDEARGMLRRMIGEDVRVETSYAPGPVYATADPSQILQVIMNLAVNARDAMPAGGVLTLGTAVEAADGRDAGREPRGPRAVIWVSDTGTGMDAETLSHLFEPFFTTKEHGKGTGLGLSTAYGIVTQSGGSISCASESGRGSTFTIRLPAARGRGETILVVEDDSSVRHLVQHTLETQGYDVLIAGDGRAGLDLLGSAARPIHLLVTDMVLPGGVSGADLAREALDRGGGRVLCISGASEELASRSGEALRRAAFLQKPFGPMDLLRAVRTALEQR